MLVEEDRLVSTATIDGTNRLPHVVYCFHVCADYIYRPTEFSQSHVHRTWVSASSKVRFGLGVAQLILIFLFLK